MNPVVMAVGVVILIFSVIVHEVMHGVVARYFGDRTAENAGRLTLNPIPHIDPIGTILLPAIMIFSGSPVLFGWAKPVPVNPLNFRDIRKGELWTSSAGIISNFAMAVAAAVLFHLSAPFVSSLISQLLIFAVTINLVLAIFNLLPIPPLDGSKILMTFLPYDLANQYRQLERYGFLILILLLFPIGGVSIINVFLGFFLNIFQRLLLGI